VSNETPSYVITLVHGTFAPNAKWTQPGSNIRRAIKTVLADAGHVRFESFVWLGLFGTRLNNGHTYRLAGGVRLQTRLAKLVERYPKARHFVIAHSHGGNVALYAMRNAALHSQIAGIVCLATPFICCRPRDVALGVEFYSGIVYRTTAAAITILTGATFSAASMLLKPSPLIQCCYGLTLNWITSSACIVIVIMLFAQQRLAPRIVKRGHLWAARRKREILERLLLPSEQAPPIFCASAEKDEAGLLLSRLKELADIPFGFWKSRRLRMRVRASSSHRVPSAAMGAVSLPKSCPIRRTNADQMACVRVSAAHRHSRFGRINYGRALVITNPRGRVSGHVSHHGAGRGTPGHNGARAAVDSRAWAWVRAGKTGGQFTDADPRRGRTGWASGDAMLICGEQGRRIAPQRHL
jgi:hypothetical protein